MNVGLSTADNRGEQNFRNVIEEIKIKKWIL
jgi:hypothetical protein